MSKQPSNLSVAELFALLSVWQQSGKAFLGALSTNRQIVFGIAHITELTNTTAKITLSKVFNSVQLSPEATPTETSFSAGDVAVAFQTTTFEQPAAGIIAEHFDEMLQIVLRAHVTGVSLYRATPFKQKRGEMAG